VVGTDQHLPPQQPPLREKRKKNHLDQLNYFNPHLCDKGLSKNEHPVENGTVEKKEVCGQ